MIAKKLRVVIEKAAGSEVVSPHPEWRDDGLPLCSDRCAAFDGKRCDILGHRPDAICEPAVLAMFKLLERWPGA